MYPHKPFYSRRRFLHLGLLTSALAISWSCSGEKAQSKMSSILVVGAGIAGLAAARDLQANGFKVTVLEGRNRLGGRIHTERSLGFPVDLGAAWIHGIKNNPIYQLAQDYQIALKPTNYENFLVYGANNKPVAETELEKGESLYTRILDRAKSQAENLDKDISIAEALQRLLKKENLTPQQEKLFKWFLNSEIVLESGADLEALSIWEWDEDDAFEGGDVLFPGGYDQIIQKLAKGLDIQLQQKVTAIEYGNNGVTVKSDRGTFQADAAVITLPLGVLKSGNVKFSPPLPKSKQAAVSRLAMGVLNKVVLKFPKIFWPIDCDGIGYLNLSEKELSYFLNFRHYTTAPVLIGLSAGNFGRSIEAISETEIVEKVMNRLRRVYGNGIPNPDAVVRTQWNSDPFSLGSYSYMPVGSTSPDRSVLAEPVAGRLFFAGEATSRQYPATTHGAFLSGIREGDRISKQFAG